MTMTRCPQAVDIGACFHRLIGLGGGYGIGLAYARDMIKL